MKKELKKRIEKMQKKVQEIQEEARVEGEKCFREAIAFLFEENQDLESFSWTQYTPHFNDGDACTFSANTEYFYINDDEDECDEWSINYEIENLKKSKSSDKEEKLKELEAKKDLSKKIAEVLTSFDDDLYEHLFGDGVKVTVYKDRIETDEYDHD